ncbi:MAG: class I SAM-dependent methyltransferase [Verrucomicrobia bacterium]|nr:class I SAM-dependent methyltransferase [Verrucomicrobiota bacterium]
MRIQSFIPLSIRRCLGNSLHSLAAHKKKKKLLKKLQGSAVECNICHWQGSRFTDDPWHAGTVCPNCGSQVRHRMLVALLDGKSMLPHFDEEHLLCGKKILHFAPERQLRDRIQKAAEIYVSTDYDRGDVDLKLDMSEMPSVLDEDFDVVIACDVLEHVPDDRAAMRELHRILKSKGLAIITAPQKDSPSQTDEDPSITSPEERTKHFGQKDHLRIFGDDLKARLEEARFSVSVIDASAFSQNAIERFVLMPPTISSHPLATNHRRFYFAKK